MQKKRWIVYGRLFVDGHYANIAIKELVPDMALYFDNVRYRKIKYNDTMLEGNNGICEE